MRRQSPRRESITLGSRPGLNPNPTPLASGDGNHRYSTTLLDQPPSELLQSANAHAGGPGDGGGANDGNGGGADGDEKNCWNKSVVDGASGESAIAESGGG